MLRPDIHTKFRHVSWPEELRLRGPLLIASTAKQCSIDEVKKANISLSHDEGIVVSHRTVFNCLIYLVANLDQKFPANSIVGRAILRDCLTWHEHKNEVRQKLPKSHSIHKTTV